MELFVYLSQGRVIAGDFARKTQKPIATVAIAKRNNRVKSSQTER
jgi:hypothetical protein